MCKGTCKGCKYCGLCPCKCNCVEIEVRLKDKFIEGFINQGVDTKFEDEFGVKDIHDTFKVVEHIDVMFGEVYMSVFNGQKRNLLKDMVDVIINEEGEKND